ncbi:hypothetical protein [Neisseria meningitidis]
MRRHSRKSGNPVRPLPFGNAIRTVRETIQYLLTGSEPVATLGR